MMKSKQLLLLAGIALTSGLLPAQAQRQAASRTDRREQRALTTQNLTPAEQMQNFEARFQERLKSATPEQQQQMIQMRAQVEERLRAQGIDPTDPTAVAQLIAGRGGNAAGGNAAAGRGGRGGRNGAAANVPLTPEQKDAQRRRSMINAGITDKDTQDDIIQFIAGEEKAHQPLLKLAQAAAATLAAGPLRVATLSNTLPQNEEKVSNAFTTYQDALAADKVRHDAALKSLDASIGYVSNPRLNAFLTLVGIIDNDALALGGASAIFAPAPPVAAVANNNAPRQAKNPFTAGVADDTAPGVPVPAAPAPAATTAAAPAVPAPAAVPATAPVVAPNVAPNVEPAV